MVSVGIDNCHHMCDDTITLSFVIWVLIPTPKCQNIGSCWFVRLLNLEPFIMFTTDSLLRQLRHRHDPR